MEKDKEALEFGRRCLLVACVASLVSLVTLATRLAFNMPQASHWALAVLLFASTVGVVLLTIYVLRLPSDRHDRRWADGSPMER